MDKIIQGTLLEFCDVSSDECALLSETIIDRLEKYIRDRPSFSVLQSTKLYNELLKYGQIIHTLTDHDYAIVQYKAADIKPCIITSDTEAPPSKLVRTPQDAVRELEGYMYSTVVSYPMKLRAELFGNNFLLLTLLD